MARYAIFYLLEACAHRSFALAAWLAGDGSPQPQSFDVWVAFEFPSFETYASPKPEMVIAPGQYTIKFTNPIDTILSLRDEDPTDGALVVGLLGEHSPPQRVGHDPCLFQHAIISFNS